MSSSGRLVPVGMGVIEVRGSSRLDVPGFAAVVSGARMRDPARLCLAFLRGVGDPLPVSGVVAAGAWMGGAAS
jgi:hypothetical protein